MGESKHTLHAVQSIRSLFWEVSVGPEYHHQSVASCIPNSVLGHTMDDAEAYARLFAAAPEMKEALEEVLRWDAYPNASCRKRIEDALAKANGERPAQSPTARCV